MDFTDVACFFDDDPVYDAYTGALLFYCHTTPHDDQTSSGATARRRTMTTVNGTVAPARGVVQLYESAWLVSDSNPDGFRGEYVRRSYSLKKSTGLMAVMSPAEACAGAPGVEFHAQKEFYRDNQDARTSGEWDTMWNIFSSRAEQLSKGDFLRQDGILFRVRNAYPSVDGYRIAETDELDADAAQSATFVQTSINIVTDKKDTINIPVSVIQTDTQKYYAFRTQTESMQKPGDRAVFVSKSQITPKVGDQFSMLGASWRVLTIIPERDVWALHVRMT